MLAADEEVRIAAADEFRIGSVIAHPAHTDMLHDDVGEGDGAILFIHNHRFSLQGQAGAGSAAVGKGSTHCGVQNPLFGERNGVVLRIGQIGDHVAVVLAFVLIPGVEAVDIGGAFGGLVSLVHFAGVEVDIDGLGGVAFQGALTELQGMGGFPGTVEIIPAEGSKIPQHVVGIRILLETVLVGQEAFAAVGAVQEDAGVGIYIVIIPGGAESELADPVVDVRMVGVGQVLLRAAHIEHGSVPLLTDEQMAGTQGTGSAAVGGQYIVVHQDKAGNAGLIFGLLIVDIHGLAVEGSAETGAAVNAGVGGHDGEILAVDRHAVPGGVLTGVVGTVHEVFRVHVRQAAAGGGAVAGGNFIHSGLLDLDVPGCFGIHGGGAVHIRQGGGAGQRQSQNEKQTHEFFHIHKIKFTPFGYPVSGPISGN